MTGRTIPDRTPEQQRDYERREALKSADIAAVRAWAEKWAIGLVGDDDAVLQAMHEARATDRLLSPTVRADSKRWLRAHAPDSTALLTSRELAARMKKGTHDGR